jgi:ribonuclease HI
MKWLKALLSKNAVEKESRTQPFLQKNQQLTASNKNLQENPKTQPPTANSWVTLYCDASASKLGSGWAVWLRSYNGRIRKQGKCPEGLTDSNEAELYAALMGIKIALEEWGHFTGIFVNSDNLLVCRSIFPWSKDVRNAKIHLIQNQIREICSANNILIRTKHIKGQNPKNGVRQYLNGRVDQMSRSSRLSKKG